MKIMVVLLVAIAALVGIALIMQADSHDHGDGKTAGVSASSHERIWPGSLCPELAYRN
jgi:hypothetical protein